MPSGSNYMFLSGLPFDHARNKGVEKVLEDGYNWLFFLDDDVVVPHDTIDRLIAHGRDIVSGIYYRRADPIVPVMMVEADPKPVWATQFTPGNVVAVDLVGSGCLLIHRRVLERVEKPWFEWLLDRDDIEESQKCSEDFAFSRKAKKAGFEILVDTSIKCQHIGFSVADERGLSPLVP
jgi:hypothetical protein